MNRLQQVRVVQAIKRSAYRQYSLDLDVLSAAETATVHKQVFTGENPG